MKALIVFLIAALLAFSSFADDTQLRIDTHGPDGVTGAGGQDGVDATTAGGHGTNARTPGKPGTAGTAGRPVQLNLKGTAEGYDAAITVDGKQTQKKLTKTAPIEIDTHGGTGGDGGPGGRGGFGAKGTRGRNANASSRTPGTDGGPGGNGGFPSEPGRGGDAGAGGDIAIIADSPEDTYLFYLLQRYSNAAGRPGRAGTPGQGGRGGSGGDGGSDDTWYEVIEHEEPGVETTEVDGVTIKTPVIKKWTEKIPHTVSGGDDGDPGMSRSNSASMPDGLPAKDGDFYFQIKGNPKRYTRLFNLSRVKMNVVDRTGDGVIEPGEAGYIEALLTRNSGYMPTPTPGKSRSLIRLPGGPWYHQEGPDLSLPKVLNEGEAHEFRERLGVRVFSPREPSLNKPLEEALTLAPEAIIDPIGKRYSDFTGGETRVVKYPVRLRLDAPPSLAQGEQGLVQFHVTNVSNLPIGISSLQKRIVSVLVKEVGEHDRSMDYLSADGDPVSLREGVTEAIELLQPNETRIFESLIQVPADFEDQSAFTFKAELNLGGIELPDVSTDIQREVQRISVATKYHTQVDSSIGLVLNSETRKEVVQAWRTLLENELGFELATWNPAYYGNFDLDKEIVGDPRWHLMKDFMSKTVIVLNDEFKTHSSKWMTAWQQLSKSALLKAIGNKDITFLVMGPVDQENASGAEFLRTDPGAGSRTYSNTDDLIQSLNILHRDRLTYKHRSQIYEDFHKVKIIANDQPSEAYLINKAKDLSRQLNALWPQRHYVVWQDYRGTILKSGWGILADPKVDFGDLIVQRLPDRNDPAVVIAKVSAKTLREDATFPASERGLRYLMSGLSYQDKVGLLDRLLVKLNHSPTPTQILAGQILADAIVSEASLDYEYAVLGYKWRGHSAPRIIARLADWRYQEAIVAGSEAETLFRRLHSRLSIAGYYRYSENLFFGSLAETACEGAFADLERVVHQLYPEKAAYRRIKKQLASDWATLQKDAGATGWASLFTWNATLNKNVERVLAQDDSTPVETSSEALKRLGDILSQSEIDSLRESDLARRHAWKQATQANLEARDRQKRPSKLREK